MTWFVLDSREDPWTEADVRFPPPDVGVPYRMPRSAYLSATARRMAIEHYYPAGKKSLRAWVTDELSALDPDVILANQPFAWATIPDRLLSRTVLDTHNVNSARLKRIAGSLGHRWPERALLARQVQLTERFEHRYVEASASTWVVSDEDKDALPRSSTVRVVPNGTTLLDLERSFLGEHESPRLLFLGSLGYSANIDALRRLSRAAQASTNDFRVTVAGSGPESEARELCARDPRFDFVGRVPDARAAMADHHALVAPHMQGGGSRIKVLEAMGTRVPVVATRVAAEGIGASPGVHYMEIEGDDWIERAIRSLRDPLLVGEMVNSAWALAAASEWRQLSIEACFELEDIARARRE
ncbi:glycosyltransferase family 4 protein [Amnibacterium setariae]|uniref:glycosyltransferase family 4 protein n=1 Tax=Amnibacterium setariae TaxID=2306585 RepID=UPI001314B6E5|nr:glycosyltransferase family 4 protein [Amnibacterium setariae]